MTHRRRLRLLTALIVLVALLGLAACGDDDDDIDDVVLEEELPAEQEIVEEVEEPDAGAGEPEAPTQDDAPQQEAGSAPAEGTGGDAGAAAADFSGLEVAGVAFDRLKVFVINNGDTTVDLTGLWICNRPDYAPLPPLELGPSEGIEVDLTSLSEAGGEAAIYSSDDFDNSDHMISYVQWGSGGGRAAVAEAAGAWEGSPVQSRPEGVFLIGEPGSAEGWQ